MVGRPEKIYLDEPIILHGIKVRHTYEGLIYLIKHYEHILATATEKQLDDTARAHCAWLINNMQQHKQLYEKNLNPKP
jgi:hypothetical protein